jgi:hypothetical protein
VCPSGQRERAVNPSAQPTEVRILPPPCKATNPDVKPVCVLSLGSAHDGSSPPPSTPREGANQQWHSLAAPPFTCTGRQASSRRCRHGRTSSMMRRSPLESTRANEAATSASRRACGSQILDPRANRSIGTHRTESRLPPTALWRQYARPVERYQPVGPLDRGSGTAGARPPAPCVAVRFSGQRILDDSAPKGDETDLADAGHGMTNRVRPNWRLHCSDARCRSPRLDASTRLRNSEPHLE